MMKVINPLNRKQDNLESAAYACNCVCSASANNHNSARWSVILPGGSTCGCGCNGTPANKNANSTKAKNY